MRRCICSSLRRVWPAMLASWGAINDRPATPRDSSDDEGVGGSPNETDEAREGRLRAAYTEALARVAAGDPMSAAAALRAVAAELSAPRAARPRRRRRRKDAPDWVRALRYAACRNLADCLAGLGRSADAVEAYGEALECDGADFLVWRAAARAALDCGRLHVARVAVERACMLRPGHWLAEEERQMVLATVGDGDEDCGGGFWEGLQGQGGREVDAAVAVRAAAMGNEKDAARVSLEERRATREPIVVAEPTWRCLVDALSFALRERLTSWKGSVGERCVVKLLREPVSVAVAQKPATALAVDAVKPTSVPKNMEDAEPTAPEQEEEDADGDGGYKRQRVDAKGNKVELRKSKRQADIGRDAARERMRTRVYTAAIDSYDWNLTEKMMAFVRKEDHCDPSDGKTIAGSDSGRSEAASDEVAANVTRPEELPMPSSGWALTMSGADEEAGVGEFVHTSGAGGNGGPLDLLLRILHLLLDLRSRAHLHVLGDVWLAVRGNAASSLPDASSMVTCLDVVDALLASADGKVGKSSRAGSLAEAQKLLSIVSALPFDGEDVDRVVVSVRVKWLQSQLAERSGEMKLARDRVLQCLATLEEAHADCGESSNHIISFAGGPEFAGQSWASAAGRVRAVTSRFSSAGELEEARSALSDAKKRKSPALAERSAEIMRRAVTKTVQQLRFVEDNEVVHSLPLPSTSARYALISQLSILTEASEICFNDADSLVCASLSMMILVEDYYGLAAERARAGKDTGLRDDIPGDRQVTDGATVELSPTFKRSEIVAQLRQYVALVKKVTTSVPSLLEAAESKYERAACARRSLALAAKTLVVVAHVLQAKIKALPMTLSSPLALTVAEKNQRLAFSRAMLGFGRCLDALAQFDGAGVCIGMDSSTCTESSGDAGWTPGYRRRKAATTRRLRALDFALRVLVPRGCVREEGTSGALIKLYTASLCIRLRELAEGAHHEYSAPRDISRRDDSDSNAIIDCDADAGKVDVSASNKTGDDDAIISLSPDRVLELAGDDATDWEDVATIRRELAQSLHTLFQLPNYENVIVGESQKITWLADGVKLSKRVAASPSDSAAANITMDLDACRAAFDFYRSYLFEALTSQWRDGRKSRRAREIVMQIYKALKPDPPPGVPIVSMPVLDAALSAALESGGRAAIAGLKEKWRAAQSEADETRPLTQTPLLTAQISRMYFEAYIFLVMSMLYTYDGEYKKQRSVERRKRPKDAVERLINLASPASVAALRSRPWSAGAWILLGRVFLEIADVALDERELAASTFGICRPEDLAVHDLGDPVLTILDRAEGCFRLADALAKEQWVPEPSTSAAVPLAALNAEAFTGFCDVPQWGSDFHFFGLFGLVDDPRDSIPALRAAVQFGLAAVHVTKLREERYRSRCWRLPALTPRALARDGDMFPVEISELAGEALKCLQKGIRYAFPNGNGEEVSNSRSSEELPVFSKMSWYYKLLAAKLVRKRGDSDPIEYLDMFADALAENARARSVYHEAADIEPFYKLHTTRLKLLLEQNETRWPGLTTALERHSYQPIATSDGVNSIANRRRAIAADISSAMEFCRGQKTAHQHSEFFFKAAYTRALALWQLMDDREGALKEMRTMFRGDSAARAIEAGNDGAHRGYFYTIWNYRQTDTGYEMALESERKYLRWRNKLMGLYGALLDESKNARVLAGVISRLKRRNPDDLPVNGAVLDDIVGAYADVCIAQAQETISDESESPTVAVSEAAVHRTWDVYTETLRLELGVRRARMSMERDPDMASSMKTVVDSHRPWCLVAAACALHLEFRRLGAAKEGRNLLRGEFDALPTNGEPLTDINGSVFALLASTLELCNSRWPVGDSKLLKQLRRRIELYQAGGPLMRSQSGSKRVDNGKDGKGASSRDLVPLAPSNGNETGIEKSSKKVGAPVHNFAAANTMDISKSQS